MAQTATATAGLKRTAPEGAVRVSERISRRRVVQNVSSSAVVETSTYAGDPVPERPTDPTPQDAAHGVCASQLGCTLGVPCQPHSATGNARPVPGPVLGLPTYPPGKGCFPPFSCPPPAFMMFMMQQHMHRQMQQMQHAAMASGWPNNGLGLGPMPSYPPGIGAFPGMPSMDSAAAGWCGGAFQSTSFQSRPSAGSPMAPSPFPLTLALPPSTFAKEQTYMPISTHCGVARQSCSATMTTSTGDKEKADSSNSHETTQADCLTDLEFATFIDSFLVPDAADELSGSVTGDAALDLQLDLSDLVTDIDATAPVDINVLLKDMEGGDDV